MNLLKLLILCLCGEIIYGLNNQIIPRVSYQHCSLETFQNTFDVLPGTGWDNLANLEMGRVLDLNFSNCLFSNDNRYLIPNQMSLIPEKQSHVELFSETFEHFMNYTSTTSKSINVNVDAGYGGFKFGGSFSYENTKIKNDQLETKSIFSRVQLKYKVYQSMFEPDALLSPSFKNRILDIAGLLIENKDYLYPSYLADMIIRDYGTHVIRAIEAGALLSKTDALNSKYVKQYQSDETTVTASASASFLSAFNINSKFQTSSTTTQMNEYNQNCQKSHIDAVGGTLFGSNFTLQQWEESVLSNLVPIDRRGDPIYYVITPRALPNIDDDTVNKLYVLLKDAVERYYTRNGRKGCLNFFSPNFNPDANIDAGNCKSPIVNFTFGGAYQTCSGPSDQCTQASQLNPLTGGYSCPEGFDYVQLHNGLNRCQSYCHSYYWFWEKCETKCSNFITYWCHPKSIGPNHNGYQFGGFLSTTVKQCPLGYIALKVGSNSEMCVSSDADPTNPFAIQFGGFFSCSVGNPLAKYYVKDNKKVVHSSKMISLSHWPKSCAEGFVAHIASIDQGCQISYCTETNKFSLGGSPELIRPPFIKLNYNPNSTETTTFKNNKGEMFTKDKSGSWDNNARTNNYTNTIIGSIVGCIVGMIIIALIAMFIQRRHYKRRIVKMEKVNNTIMTNLVHYGSINESDSV